MEERIMNNTQRYVSGCLCWLTNKIDLNFESSEQDLENEFLSKCTCSRHHDILAKDCWDYGLSKKDRLDLKSKISNGYFGNRAFWKGFDDE